MNQSETPYDQRNHVEVEDEDEVDDIEEDKVESSLKDSKSKWVFSLSQILEQDLEESISVKVAPLIKEIKDKEYMVSDLKKQVRKFSAQIMPIFYS